MPKEIRDYQESIFFGLSARQFICSLLAVGVAVGLYFGLRPLVGSEEVGWMCILGAAPFGSLRLFQIPRHDRRTGGLGLVQVGISLSPKKLVFKSDSLYFDAMKNAIAEGEKLPRKRKGRNSQPSAEKEP